MNLIETDEEENSIFYLYDRSGNRLFYFNKLFEEEIASVYRYKDTALFLVDVYDWAGNELTGMVNEEGALVIPALFDSIEDVGEGLFKVFYNNPNDTLNELGDVVKNKYGVYEDTGKEIFSPQFDAVEDFDRRISIAEIGSKAVLIHRNGNMVRSTESKSIDRVSRMHYILHKNEGDQLFIRPDDFGGIYDYADLIDNRNVYFIASKAGKSILIDLYMKEVATYDALFDDSDFLLVGQKEKWGVINYHNEIIVPFTYDHLDYFDDTRYLVKQGGKFGLIQKTGKQTDPCIHDDAQLLFEKYKVPNRTRNLR